MTLQTLVTWYYGLKPVQTPTALPVQIPTEAEVFWLLRSLVCWSRQKFDFSEKKTALTAWFCTISTVPTSTMSSSPLIRSTAAPETTVNVTSTTTSPTSDLATAVMITQPKAVSVTTNTIAPMMTVTITLPTRSQTTNVTPSIQQLTKISHTEKPGKTLLYHTHARAHAHTHTHMLVFMVYGDFP